MKRYEKFVLEAEKGITFEVSEGTSGELIIRALNIATANVYSTNYVNPPIPEGYKHVCGESQVLRVFASIFGQCDKQQGHRGEALLAVDELASADTIRADAAVLHPHDRPGEMGSVRIPASRYDVGPQLPALRLAP